MKCIEIFVQSDLVVFMSFTLCRSSLYSHNSLFHHTQGFIPCTIFFFFISRVSYIHSCFYLTLSQLLSRLEHNLTETLLSSTHTHTHTHTLMGCRLIHHISIRSIGNKCRDLYKTQLLLSPSMLHYFIIWPCVGHAHTEGERETSSKHLHLPTYMTPSLVLRAASSTPALVFSAAATTPSLAMENPFIRASILDVEFDNDALQTDWAWQNLQGLKVSVYMLKFSDDRREEYREILCRDKWMHGHSERRAVEWERERAASRRKRTGCRETEPAGCCSAFKSCCGYSPHPHVLHTHTHARTHARTHTHTHTADTHWLSQQCRTDWLYIYYALASSALRPDASYNYCNSLAPWGHASCLTAWLIISLFLGINFNSLFVQTFLSVWWKQTFYHYHSKR